jgi:hypothetical protein
MPLTWFAPQRFGTDRFSVRANPSGGGRSCTASTQVLFGGILHLDRDAVVGHRFLSDGRRRDGCVAAVPRHIGEDVVDVVPVVS